MRGRWQSSSAVIGLIWALVFQCPVLHGEEFAPTQINFQDCPAGSEVYLDGSWIGTTNASNRFQIRGLLPGTYQFSFKKDGQLIHSCSVPVVAGQSVSIPVAPVPVPPAKNIPARIRREAVPTQPAAATTVTPPQTVPPPLPQASRLAAKTAAPAPLPPGIRPAVPPIASVDERVVLFPLLAVMLVLGGLLAARFFTRHPVPPEGPAATAATQTRTEPTVVAGARSGDASRSEPEFLDDLRLRESLFQKGFSKPKRVSNRDIVVDIDSYEVGKEI